MKKSARNIYTPLSFILAILLVSSCKEEIKLPIPDAQKKLVVESEITTETDSSFVKLTISADYYSNDPYPKPDDAIIKVNGISFNNIPGTGIYRPPSPYTGLKGERYDLEISRGGKVYTSSAILEPMFRIDSLFQVFKPREGFQREGWSVNYMGYDSRPKIKYTYFRLGYFDTLVHHDTLQNFKVLFNNELGPNNVEYSFELPFTRFQKGDECIMIFRSCEKSMNDFITAYEDQTSNAPGPFHAPPANLPTNIRGEGVAGYFATYDLVRKRYTIR